MDDLFESFEWATDSPLAIITYGGLWLWTVEDLKPWEASHPSWLTIIGMFVGASLVAALGTVVIGWALRLGWRILRIAWLVIRLLPAALRGLVFVALGALVWLSELGGPPKWPRKKGDTG
jgi:hypothetical protein